MYKTIKEINQCTAERKKEVVEQFIATHGDRDAELVSWQKKLEEAIAADQKLLQLRVCYLEKRAQLQDELNDSKSHIL